MDAVEPSLFRLSYKTEDPTLMKLAECYWATCRANGRVKFKYHVVNELAPRFGLRKTSAGVTGPVMLAAAAYYRCPECGEEVQVSHRTAFSQGFGSFNNGRSCPRCQEKQSRAHTAARRKAIRRIYRVEHHVFEFNRFTLKDAVFSLAVLHASGFCGSPRIARSDSFRQRISPCTDYDGDILAYLYNRGILAADPNSDEESFIFDTDGEPNDYLPNEVRWRLCDAAPLSFAARLGELVARKTFPKEWVADVEPLSREIALYECIECFETFKVVNHLRWTFPPEFKRTLSRLLDTLPVCRIQPMVYHAMTQTYDLAYQREIDEQECGDLFREKLNALTGLIRNGKTPVEELPGLPRFPRSAVSFIFYESLLHVGDDGFTKPPGSFRLQEENFATQPMSPLKAATIAEAIELSKRGQQRPLLSYLAGLSAADRAQIAAVMLIGRGDERSADFNNIVMRWTRPLDGMQPEYLAGKRRLWQFLERGLEELAHAASC